MKHIKHIIVSLLFASASPVLAEVTLDSILNQELVGTPLGEALPYRDTSTPEAASRRT